MVGPEHNAQPPATQPSPPAAVPLTLPIYAATELNRELRQCEIISDVIQHVYRAETKGVDEVPHPYTIVLSQDCDLLREFDAAEKQEPGLVLNSILVYEAEPWAFLKPRLPAGRDIWKRIVQNKDERYQFLEAVPPELDLLAKGIPELVIDFRRYFTIPSRDMHRQCCGPSASARRRCRLDMPYREHLQCRAAFYMQRVMLPRGHREP